ncbi:MAG TPA: hypothetical protein VK146_11370 [Tabrizicola sp.]|nr:hypothetical protein [Tabrizicola sp.]
MHRLQARNPAASQASTELRNSTFRSNGVRAAQVMRQKIPVVFTQTKTPGKRPSRATRLA